MPRRILCVQLADIGDLVLTTPALSALREALPHAHITLLTTPHAAPVIDESLVDKIITFDKHTFDSPRALAHPKNWGKLLQLWRSLDMGVYDTTVFFHHFSTLFGTLKFAAMALASGSRRRIGLRSSKAWFLNDGVRELGFGALHQAKYWLRLVELAAGERGEPVYVLPRNAHLTYSSATYENLEHVWSEIFDRPGKLEDEVKRIAMHAGSGGYSTARRWEAEKFAAVAQKLIHEHDAHIIFVGTQGDGTEAVLDKMFGAGVWHAKPLPNVTDLTGRTKLSELIAVLHQCDLFIGADSGVMHMAAATGVPTVAVFGPSNQAAWKPWQLEGKISVVRSAPICSPCSYVGTGVGLRVGCEARTCMKMVTAEQVYDAAEKLLDNQSPVGAQRAAPLPNHHDRVKILGVPVDKVTYASMLERIGAWIAAKDGLHQICTTNPEFVMIAQHDPNFFNILNRVDLNLPDGIGLIYAARYLGDALPMRVTGSDGVPAIAERAAKEGWRLFLLGAAEGIAERAANVLCERYPDLQIAGTYSGTPSGADEDAIVERINAANADILFVAYGAPQQDKWIARNAPRLNVSVAMGVGGTFDYLAGEVALAPQWMRNAGLEWLFRLIQQPGRFRRQLRLPAFVIAVLLRGRGDSY